MPKPLRRSGRLSTTLCGGLSVVRINGSPPMEQFCTLPGGSQRGSASTAAASPPPTPASAFFSPPAGAAATGVKDASLLLLLPLAGAAGPGAAVVVVVVAGGGLTVAVDDDAEGSWLASPVMLPVLPFDRLLGKKKKKRGKGFVLDVRTSQEGTRTERF